MMSANAPLDFGAGPSANDATPALTASVSVQPSDSMTAPTTQQAPWETFHSTEEFEAWLIETAVAEYGHMFGKPAYNYISHFGGIITSDAVLLASSMGQVRTASDADYSSTNVQVAGVDEADLVETDGDYLYIISGKNLVIVEVGIGDELRVVSRRPLEGRPVGMYLSGDRLAIISSSPAENGVNNSGSFRVLNASDQNSKHGVNRATTTVTVLDISDRAAPELVQKTEMDGQLVTSRSVNGQLRLVVSNELRLPRPITNPVGAVQADAAWGSTSTGSTGVYETQQEYLARVRGEVMEALSPRIRNLALDGSIVSESSLYQADELNRPESRFDRQITTIATFDLASNRTGPASKASVLSNSPQVYSTEESVYIFSEKPYDWGSTNTVSSDAVAMSRTKIWQFDINAETNAVKRVASGTVDGALLNQFAADEHDGFLRVVTKSNAWEGTGQSLFVLEQVGRKLEIVSRLTGIAPNENLYSVRFLGERAFFVTFRQIDPLYSVDLSDPRDPKLLGELHIPGYSDYLQPLDENHLLAIGRGANEGTGNFEELQISIFDVTDLTDPQLLHRYSFGGGRSTATVATGDRWTLGDGDHHAVGYFPSEQILALPIFAAGGSWDGMPIFEIGQGGLQLFKIDVGAGFTSLGLIEHDTRIERSVQIGDYLYAISSGTVSVHELADPMAPLGEISIAAEQGPQPARPDVTPSPVETISIVEEVESINIGERIESNPIKTGFEQIRIAESTELIWITEQFEPIRFVPGFESIDIAAGFEIISTAMERAAELPVLSSTAKLSTLPIGEGNTESAQHQSSWWFERIDNRKPIATERMAIINQAGRLDFHDDLFNRLAANSISGVETRDTSLVDAIMADDGLFEDDHAKEFDLRLENELHALDLALGTFNDALSV